MEIIPMKSMRIKSIRMKGMRMKSERMENIQTKSVPVKSMQTENSIGWKQPSNVFLTKRKCIQPNKKWSYRKVSESDQM